MQALLFSRIRRGINLSHWFSQVYATAGYTPAHFDSYIKETDIRLIREMGFDHVRFPIACEPMMQSGVIPPSYLERILTTLEMILNSGLAVIADIHPETPFKERLRTSPEAVGEFCDFWSSFAKALSKFPSDSLCFEILNEPCIYDAERWNEIQLRVFERIRQVAPSHTVIFSGDDCSQIPELLKLRLPEDPNIIANFHLYDPIAFTHQGASWSPHWAMFTKGLSYPVDSNLVDQMIADTSDSKAREKLTEYVKCDWRPSIYREFIEPAVQWGRANNVSLTCNEFGVYKDFSPRDSRVRWCGDLAAVLSEAGIGWSMWDYAGSFAVVMEENGVRSPDFKLIEALSLPQQTQLSCAR